jgi:4'-phosphopantetheinyl transferase
MAIDTRPDEAVHRLDGAHRPAAGHAELWFGWVPEAMDVADDLVVRILDGEEQRRAAAFAQPRHRVRYVAAHLGLRSVLGGYLGLPAAEVALTREPCPLCRAPHGRPAVAARPPLHFSMSHAGDIVVYAVARDPVGVDVELRASNDPAAIGRYLHPAERAAVDRLTTAQHAEALLGCWVRKEAYLKGIGTGLAIELDAVHVGLPAHLSPPGGQAALPPGWALADLDIEGAHAAAIALATGTRGGTVRMRLRSLDLDALVTAVAHEPEGRL